MELERPRVSAVVCLVSEERTLLGFRNNGVGWQWPGGKVDAGELVEDAACRELMEETGIVVEPWALKLVSIVQHTNQIGSWVLHLFTFDMLSRTDIPRNNEPDKFLEWEWKRWSNIFRIVEGYELGHAMLPEWRMHDVLRHIVTNASKPREQRIRGYQTHCLHCHRRIPCPCMGVVCL